MSLRDEHAPGWRVWWSASELGYRVMVCNRARIVHRYDAECLGGESRAAVRMRAAGRAVELAFEFRVPLAEIVESPGPL